MAQLFDVQYIIYEKMVKLCANFKKDSIERKTLRYFKSRLETLEEYWAEYQYNHDRLSTEESRSHEYFTKGHYNKTNEYYKGLKGLITQQYQDLIAKSDPGSLTEETLEVGMTKGATIEQTNTGNHRETTVRQANQGTNSRLDDMLRKQFANFKAFLRTVSNINLNSINDKWEFEDVLKALHSRWVAIDSLHWEIDSELNEENLSYENTYSEHELTYNKLKKEINIKRWSVAHREKSTPILDIPIFHGNYNQWVSFKDLFTESIHNNPALSSAQKMQFLKSKVRGEAERLIQHLAISSENYSVCWDILNNRYNNKKLIFTSHMNILLGLPVVHQQSLSQIKNMHDVTLECTHAIKNLGIDISTWDPILVHVLSQKLDIESYTDYVESLKNCRELPILQDFLNYLESKFTTLESSRRKQPNITQRSDPRLNLNNNIATPNLKKQYHYQSNNYNNYNQNITHKPIVKSYYVSVIKCPLCNNDHGIYNCKTFLDMPQQLKLNTANKLKLCLNCLFSHNGNPCISTKRCRKCQAQHNTLIHEACVNSTSGVTKHKNTSHVSQTNCAEILLATAQIKVKTADGTFLNLRALIDQGSQISLISENAAQLLGIKRQKCKGVVYGVGQKENNCKGMINITCLSKYTDFKFNVDTFIMKNLIKHLPNQTFEKPKWSLTENINLADPEFFISRPVDILLGADVYSMIMLGGIIKGDNITEPIAQQTHLGWLLCGSVKTFQCNVLLTDVEAIQKFWEVEEITEQSEVSQEEKECMQFYASTTKRREDGRYEVRIPLKQDVENKLGSSKAIATAQFLNLERKLTKQNNLARKYKEFIREYQDLNHMIPVSDSNLTLGCYLPHHGVERADSTTTSLRVVFNASSKTTSGQCLNDLMYKGPNLQQDLQTLLLKWRQYPYAFTADIEKMYRQILVNEKDQVYQKIIWRDDPSKPLQSFQLTTVTYGTKSAPFLAMMTLKKLAIDERATYPEASQVLEEAFYMDDLLHGVYSIEQGKQLIMDLNNLLQSGGFLLRKWATNNTQLLNRTSNRRDNNENILFNFKSEGTKTLGLCWSTEQDKFIFTCNMSEQTTTITKRCLLSEISKLYDPLGWLAPVTTKLKILFQKLWKINMQWDDVVPKEINNEWSKIRADIDNIKQCAVPRWIGCNNNNDVIQLHGFCDASMQAYGCVVYAKIKNTNKVTLLAAKTKLVPNKKSISLPRLELNGAHLLTKLFKKIMQCLCMHNIEIYGWTDSMVVLGWINGESSRWKPYVSNRVKYITSIISSRRWGYVKSNENPADPASRGLYASQLKNETLWWQGPTWMHTFEENTKKEHIYTTNEEERVNQTCIIQSDNNSKSIIFELLNKFHSFTKITRILAWILRTLTPKQLRKHYPSYLTLPELRKAKLTIIKNIQRVEFSTDIDNLLKNKTVDRKSKLLPLNPIIDNNGILRVGGRLKNANISQDMMHPILIPHSSQLTNNLIDHAHKITFHGGARLTLAWLRQKYWIIGGNRAVKIRLRHCIKCRKHSPSIQHQMMADLPQARVNPTPPFYHTGVDYTGFVDVKTNRGRGAKTTKGYIAVFICMVTKAVHLELVSDLSSSTFLAALRRMAARRGVPRHLYSDNGTNFVGAEKILKEEYERLQNIFNDNFYTEITEMNIQWHRNAPLWPSAGGLWERAVRSLKFHLKRVIGEQKLTFEEYTTILTQLEGCLNSRPLCPLTEDIEDLDFLTPAHFLTGRPGLSVIETEQDARTRWHLTRKLFEEIWKRWKSEYLSQLSSRSKWFKQQRNMKIGDLVTIKDENIPPGKWPMGRVVEIHPGKDDLVRVVTLKTKNGYIKRPVVKLSLLPLQTTTLDQIDTGHKPKTIKIKPQNSQSNVAYITMAIMFFMTLITSSYGSYNITTLKSNQSLYFDPIAKMNLIRDKWTMIVYYNMDPYWENIQVFDKLLKHLDNTCSILSAGNLCYVITSQLRHEYKEIQYYNQLLLAQHFNERHRQRKRRGLINGVGYLANSLFGVLDERFAEKYTEDIKLIQQNENHIMSLWKNQTSIIESQYNLLKRTEEYVTKHYKAMNKHLNSLDNASNIIKQKVNNMSLIQDFTLSALIASNMLQNIKTIQEYLLDTITDIYHGQFNLHLLSPEQLQAELSKISGQLTNEVTLPIENINLDLNKLYKLLKVKARMTTEYLIFEVTFPLLSRDRYKLYEIIAIPHRINNISVQIIPISNYIAINLRRDTYLSINSDDLNLCLYQENMYMCQVQKPIYQLMNDNNFCVLNQNSNKCQITKTVCTNQWWPLRESSLYLYYYCNSYMIKVICEEHVTSEYLTGAGIIRLDQKCVIKGLDFTLHSNEKYQHKIKMQPNMPIPQIDPMNTLIKIDIPINSTTYEIETNELNSTLQNIGKQLNIMKQNNFQLSSISTHDVHHYAISYILVIVAIIVIAILVCRCRRQQQQENISSNIELHSIGSVSAVNARKQSNGHRRPSVVMMGAYAQKFDANQTHITSVSAVSEVRKVDKSCSPIPRKHLES